MSAVDLRIIAFLCNWCAYDGADAAGRARLDVPPQVREIRVMCSGQVDAGMVLNAFGAGADGVLVLGCKPGDCHYRDGNLHARRRMRLLQAVLEPTAIDARRLRLGWVAAGQAAEYVQLVSEMLDTIRSLGRRETDDSQEVAQDG
jgi:coenzyme F420-reducing hydrogenase delta subunit